MDKIASAKPFLKWAGGKTQLLTDIEKRLPKKMLNGEIDTYIEPFVGSGAVLFFMLEKFKFNKVYIIDVNPDLIGLYRALKTNVDLLIEKLRVLEKNYLKLNSEEKKEFYYLRREEFNSYKSTYGDSNLDLEVSHASLMLFLNRTCFNGLYRVNKKGNFNVPMGNYVNPTICNESNLLAVSDSLQNVEIILGDYKKSRDLVTSNTFIYFDPPYRPLSQSSSFTSYSEFDFTDREQIELAEYFNELNKMNAYLMLSNSDPKNSNPNDNFFEEIYNLKSFNIDRVNARRMINSKSANRGEITEILITNY